LEFVILPARPPAAGRQRAGGSPALRRGATEESLSLRGIEILPPPYGGGRMTIRTVIASPASLRSAVSFVTFRKAELLRNTARHEGRGVAISIVVGAFN